MVTLIQFGHCCIAIKANADVVMGYKKICGRKKFWVQETNAKS